MTRMWWIVVMGMTAVGFAQPQGPDTLWTRDYFDSTSALNPVAVMATPDGGFTVGGTWEEFGYPNFDAGLMKMDGNGDVQWSHRFGLHEVQEYVNGALRTSDGGLFLV
jgi:hypothetical protein